VDRRRAEEVKRRLSLKGRPGNRAAFFVPWQRRSDCLPPAYPRKKNGTANERRFTQIRRELKFMMRFSEGAEIPFFYLSK
jgi:hypothetical protein